MKDIVIGSITDYKFKDIEPYVNSLDQSGFDGLKLMLCFNIDYDTVEELVRRNYSILTFQKGPEGFIYDSGKNFNVVVDRFLHYWFSLKQQTDKFRYIIATDVKDVIFQSNPSLWVDENIGDKEIIASCESIKYKDEKWGLNNLHCSFGAVWYDHLKDNLIYNAGVMAGKFDTMIDLFQNIYMLCLSTGSHIPGGGGPDQAAYNIILNMKPYKDVTKFVMSEDGWAAQLGTTGPQVQEKFGEYIVEPIPTFKDGKVYTNCGHLFPIIHQYDRVPGLKQSILEIYK